VSLNIMRILLLTWAMLLSALAPTAAQAQQPPSPEALAAAREFVSITSSVGPISDYVGKAVAQSWPQVEMGLRSKNPKIDAETLAELRREFERILVGSLVMDMTDSAPIYARYFTVQELRELSAFYRTPTGAKALTVIPGVDAEIQRHLAARQPQFTAMANQAITAILQRRGFAQ